MKIYTVHHRSEVGSSLAGLSDGAILIKEGFCWPAFFAPLIWLIYKRMWWVLAGFIAVSFAFTGLAALGVLNDSALLACSLAINLIMGFEGNELYRWTLARQRYKLAEVVCASGLEEAEHRYFSAVTAASTRRTSQVTA